jgi:hypothetical protein
VVVRGKGLAQVHNCTSLGEGKWKNGR